MLRSSRLEHSPHRRRVFQLISGRRRRSDADSDVLADYVLALIRADTPEPDLRANAIENLEDFLKDST